MFSYHSLIPWGSFRGRQEEKWGSFRGQFGDNFRVGDHFGVGIISGAVQNCTRFFKLNNNFIFPIDEPEKGLEKLEFQLAL